MPTVSEELIGPFNVMVAASLGEHENDIDWAKVEPHIAYQHGAANQIPSFHYISMMRALERMSRQLIEPFGRDLPESCAVDGLRGGGPCSMDSCILLF